MKPTDFATHLTGFLSVYLPRQKNASNNTIASYRDTFKLLLRYCQEEKDIPAEKLNMGMLTHVMIADFLEWLEKKRKCSTATRNQRLAAIHSFFRYAQYEEPSGILHFQKVIAIPVKKASKPSAPHLTPEAMKFLLSQPDKMTVKGRRNLSLLSLSVILRLDFPLFSTRDARSAASGCLDDALIHIFRSYNMAISGR
ncbi:tyrosine-type recombinase/integrase [Desulfosarcina ovata]|uniref:Core-binding (CB) domain-containing protein n=1 Tax=Desulfosarcina ovata subsp. ovata TaxID=2752305 RepID=A0A5K8A520_9BACT|nr:site-specific integrase [Desulfosarcina ovata]BBO87591.1 hypothetical protein DSCOOX_07710 [Desulfosarcina ovata subsp. ovata]